MTWFLLIFACCWLGVGAFLANAMGKYGWKWAAWLFFGPILIVHEFFTLLE